jgi:phosphomannomutase/phosphoglucomutase
VSIFKACDIRGVVGDQWDAADANRIGRSLGHLIRRRGGTSICVGGDFRRSTPSLKQALIDGLTESGTGVFNVGQLPTPVVYFAAAHLKLDNVAVVTASHNPGKYNGIKFLVSGQPAVPELVRELQEGLDLSEKTENPGTIQSRDVLKDYEAWVPGQSRSLLAARTTRVAGVERSEPPDDEPRTRHPIHIVLDSMGGAFTTIAPRVLGSLGYRVTSLWEHIDPDFSQGDPNPARDANLQPLIERVVGERAHIGVALDGDGDRVIFIDHTGAIVRPEQIAAVFVRHCFQRPMVIYDLKCASVVPRVVEAAGGTAVMRPSGHGFIKAAMIEREADMGVEVSGHHFFHALGGGDDGLFTALGVLGLVEKTGILLADLVGAIGWPAITPDLRVPFDGDAVETLEAIANSCGVNVTRLDGVRADYDAGWALARASITEPAITFRFEGRDRPHLREIASRFLAATPRLRDQVMEMIRASSNPSASIGS